MADAPVNATFQFELVSPEKILVSEEVKMVVVPGEEGDFGVLAQHAPLLSSIRPGVVSVTGLTGEVRRIFVAGGFADVSPSLLSVLAEEAVNVDEIDKGQLEQDLKNLEDDLGFAKDDPAKASLLQSQIETTKAKIKAAA
ncbi:MAG: F0F1 ATP synthase subunit epsilon [Alphaproteobacteria bacterium]|nr:MAG: F0F1 ATP synthase subunit epsilon [Alphaproteobacteria bacterium]